MFQQNTVYIVGESKASSNNPITQQFNCFFIGFVIDRDTHEIVDAECSTTISITSRFIQSMLVGKSILRPMNWRQKLSNGILVHLRKH